MNGIRAAPSCGTPDGEEAQSSELLSHTGAGPDSTSNPVEYDYFDLASIGLIVTDATGHFRRVNRAFCQIVARRPDELIGATFASITDPDDIAANEELLARLVDKEIDGSTGIEKRYRRRNGTIIWVKLEIHPILDANQDVADLLVEVFDITDRKDAEALALRELRDFEQAQRVAHIGSFEQDHQSGMLVVSPELARILCIESIDPIPATRLMEAVHPDDRAQLGAAIEACITRHTPVDLEHRLNLADGTFRWVHAQAEWIEAEPGGYDRMLGTVLDITDRKVAERTAAAGLRQLERAQEFAHIGSFERDLKRDCFEVSVEGCRIFGLEPSGPVPVSAILKKIHPDDLQRLKAAMEAASMDRQPFDMEFRVVPSEGTVRWVHAQGGWTLREDDGEEQILTTVLDITARKVAEDALSFEGIHDLLTGLPNRAAFLEKVDNALNVAQRQARPFAVLLLDVDDFKTINDALGHQLGDELLVDLSHRLVAVMREGDFIARTGGDEFAVLVESGDVRHGAEQLAQRIIESLLAPFSLPERETELSVSIGVVFSDQAADFGAMLRSADLAMYLAKNNGKGRYELAEAGMAERALERLDTIDSLRRAVELHEFVIFYQAIVDTQRTRVVGAEALVRWNHPVRGLLTPDVFIELAEASGLIIPIGKVVRRGACQQLAAWRASGLVNDDFYISVNVSPRQLMDPAIVGNVALDLEATGLPARALVLEVTESTLANDFTAGLERVRQLKAAGVRIAIDDYGTGYSSLSRLADMPVDIIKIDKSFIDFLTSSGNGAALVKSVVDAAAALNMATVAEGVENEGQCAALAALGCTHVQGYLFAKPAPPGEAQLIFERLRGDSKIESVDSVDSRVARAKMHTEWPSLGMGNTSLAKRVTKPRHVPPGYGNAASNFGALVLVPSVGGSLFPLFAAVCILVSLPFTKFEHNHSYVLLLGAAAVAASVGCTRYLLRNRLPEWTINLDVAVGDLFILMLCLIDPKTQVPYAMFFAWTSVVVALYFRPRLALIHAGAVSVTYAIALWIGPGTTNPGASWIFVSSSVVILSLITVALVNTLRASSDKDQLTGLANRRAWDARLDEELARAQRSHAALSLAMIDIDAFKEVNDRDGHAAGDKLLCAFADAWREAVRGGGDSLARLGGDEFAVIAPDTGSSDARRLARRLTQASPRGSSCSVGVATWDGVETADELSKRADEAMYQVKRERRSS